MNKLFSRAALAACLASSILVSSVAFAGPSAHDVSQPERGLTPTPPPTPPAPHPPLSPKPAPAPRPHA